MAGGGGSFRLVDIRESYAYPANRPGSGIKLDEEAVRRYLPP